MSTQYVLLFLVLAVHSDHFQILQSYTLLLKPPVLIHSWTTHSPSLPTRVQEQEDVTLQHTWLYNSNHILQTFKHRVYSDIHTPSLSSKTRPVMYQIVARAWDTFVHSYSNQIFFNCWEGPPLSCSMPIIHYYSSIYCRGRAWTLLLLFSLYVKGKYNKTSF